MPSEREIQQYRLHHYRKNPTAGAMLSELLTVEHPKICQFSALPSTNLESLLDNLEDNPWPRSQFLEISECPSPFPKRLGLLIEAWDRATGGHAYAITLFNEERFPGSYAGRAEITAYRGQRAPFAGVLIGPGEFKSYNADDESWKTDRVLSLALAGITHLHTPGPTHYISLDQATLLFQKKHPDAIARPPRDFKLERLLTALNKGTVQCNTAQLPIDVISPHSLEFCLLYPATIIRATIASLRMTKPHAMVVYAENGKYVMSDDYCTYLAYRAIGIHTVPVVVIGEFPDRDLYPHKAGGKELLPGLMVMEVPNYDGLDQNMRNLLLDQRLERDLFPREKDLAAILFVFYELLAENNAPERQLHDFVKMYPVILHPSVARLVSEVTLGPYRADLLIEIDGDSRTIILIELERSNLPIFTKSGRLRAPVVHAIQQVEDWLQWWRENPSLVPSGFDARIPPEGLVVIGRSLTLSDDEKRRLVHLNHHRKVKVLTYDDLALRCEQMALNLRTR
jgi:hypothetical protein